MIPWPRKITRKDVDKVTGVSTTGHEWDGIKGTEQSLAALVAVGVLRLDRLLRALHVRLSRHSADQLFDDGSLLGWHSRAAVVTDLEQLNETRGTNYAAIREAELDEIVADAQMASFRPGLRGGGFRR